MLLSFRVVLAVLAALTASVTVSADIECHTAGGLCGRNRDCCRGYVCASSALLGRDEPETGEYLGACESQ